MQRRELFIGFRFKRKNTGSNAKVVGFSDYAKIFDNLKRKNSTFLTPLN